MATGVRSRCAASLLWLLLCVLILGCNNTSTNYNTGISIRSSLLTPSVRQVKIRYSTDTFRDSLLVLPVSGRMIDQPAAQHVGTANFLPPYRVGFQTILLDDFRSNTSDNFPTEYLQSLSVMLNDSVIYQAEYRTNPDAHEDWHKTAGGGAKKNDFYYVSGILYLGFDTTHYALALINKSRRPLTVQYTTSDNQPKTLSLSTDSTRMNYIHNFTVISSKPNKNIGENLGNYLYRIRIVDAENPQNVFIDRDRNIRRSTVTSSDWQFFYNLSNNEAQYNLTLR